MIIICAALGTFGSFAYGESVLISTAYPAGKEIGKESASLLETGAMDLFFAQGHIVYSAGLNQSAYHESFETSSIRIAKNCGARYLFEIYLHFESEQADKNDPEAVSYRLYDLSRERELDTGDIGIDGSDAEELSLAGAHAAAEIIDRL